MKKGLKVSRAIQLVGALLLVLAIVSCSTGGLERGGEVGWKLLLGLTLVIGARIYEWFVKE